MDDTILQSLLNDTKKQEIQQQIKICESKLKANTNSELNAEGIPWSLDFTNKELNLSVYSSEVPNSNLKRFKAECIIENIQPVDLLDVITNVEERIKWDRNMTKVEEYVISNDPDAHENEKIIVLHCETKAVGPISGRDFVDLIVLKKCSDGSTFSTGISFDIADPLATYLYPIQQNIVRGYNHYGSGSYIQPLPEGNGSKISYVIQTDLKGWFLSYIVNSAIGGSFNTYFADLKEELKRLGYTKKI